MMGIEELWNYRIEGLIPKFSNFQIANLPPTPKLQNCTSERRKG
jgi:hypothetical protein